MILTVLTVLFCFIQAAAERYLNQSDGASSYHRVLAEYFLDVWSDVPKPYGNRGESARRYVRPQPLFSKVQDKDGDNNRVYNLRKLQELPHHLLKSNQFAELKEKCLCNYEFLLAKITATSLETVLQDLQMALRVEPKDLDLRYLSDALHLSSKGLQKYRGQLASQIVGRLYDLVSSDVRVAPGDPFKYPFLKSLLSDAIKDSSSLSPSKTCLLAPGGILFDILSGHSNTITAVATTSDGQRAVTSAKDNTLKLWDLATGRVRKTIAGVGTDVRSLRLALGNSAVITSERSCIRIFSLKSGNLMADVNQSEDPACITTALGGSLLVAFFDGSHMMRVWNIADAPASLTTELRVKDETEQPIHKDRAILCAPACLGTQVLLQEKIFTSFFSFSLMIESKVVKMFVSFQVLYAFRSSKTGIVRDVKSSQVVHELCRKSGSITALASSREYHILSVRMNYMALHEIFQLELFDTRQVKTSLWL